MLKSFLEQIRPEIISRVSRLKQQMPMEEWEKIAFKRQIKANFQSAISREGTLNVIAEIKKASPSQGVLREDFDAAILARIYEKCGAAAISVLTEEKYFQGSIQSLAQVAMLSSLPLLRKDFILDEVQIAQARSKGASAVLLIVAFLDQPSLVDLIRVSAKYSLPALVEVHDEHELLRANEAGASIIGVNNRNLGTLKIDLRTSEKLITKKAAGQVFVAESGLTSNAQLRTLHTLGYDAFLIGEHFMKADDPGLELSRLRGEG